jgi:hypothetical protein
MRPEVQAVIRSNPTFPLMERFMRDPGAFLDHMTAEGVLQAWLVNYCARSVIGYGPEVNAWISEYVATDATRLVAVGGIEATSKDPAADARELVRLGIKLLKIHPVHQHVHADDKRLHPAYRELQERRMPVIIHTGSSKFPGADNQYADPAPVARLAAEFPDLPIIIAHGGRPNFTKEALAIVAKHPNTWLDLSSCPPSRLAAYFGDLNALAERTLWGSDWPGPGVPGMGANIQAFKALGLAAETQRKILHDNAKTLLGRVRAS